MARRKEFDREAALDRAMHLFWRRGYEASSLTELLSAMRISRQSLYDTFGDKRRLFLAALDRYCAAMNVQLLGKLTVPHAAKAEIAAALDGAIEFFLAFPERRACLMANTAMELAPHDKMVAQKVKAFMDAVESGFRQALARADARGELPPDLDLAALSRFFTGVMNGIAVAAKSGAPREALADVARTALSVLQMPTSSATKPASKI